MFRSSLKKYNILMNNIIHRLLNPGYIYYTIETITKHHPHLNLSSYFKQIKVLSNAAVLFFT